MNILPEDGEKVQLPVFGDYTLHDDETVLEVGGLAVKFQPDAEVTRTQRRSVPTRIWASYKGEFAHVNGSVQAHIPKLNLDTIAWRFHWIGPHTAWEEALYGLYYCLQHISSGHAMFEQAEIPGRIYLLFGVLRTYEEPLWFSTPLRHKNLDADETTVVNSHSRFSRNLVKHRRAVRLMEIPDMRT